jgi:transcriptional regulator
MRDRQVNQVGLASMLGTSRANVSRLLTRDRVELRSVIAVAEVFGMTVELSFRQEPPA